MPSQSSPGPSATREHADFQHALALHGAGRLADAQAVCERLIGLNPGNFAALHLQGVMAFQTGQFPRAVDLIAKAIRLHPNDAAFHCNHGNALAELKQTAAAIASYDRAIALKADFADAHYNRGNVLQELQQLEAAVAGYDRAIACNAGFAEAHYSRGIALQELGQRDAALASYDIAVALKPGFAAACYNRGNLLQDFGRFEAAVASYDLAIAAQPDFVAAFYNRGNALKELDRLEDAVASYDRVIALRPDLAAAHLNRGNALSQLQRSDEALQSYANVLKADPGHAEVRRCIFWHHFSELKDPALVERLSEDLAAANSNKELAGLLEEKQMAEFRVLHDLEQTAYLLALGYESDGLRAAHDRLRDAYARYCREQSPSERSGAVQLSAEELVDICRFRKTPLQHRSAAPIAVCLNPDNDWAAIEQQYFSGTPEIIHIDDLLSPEALAELRKFCLISTIWKTEYQNQYLGVFAHDGFVSPVLFQLAQELQRKMPRIFGGHMLEQLWGFKYNSHMRTGLNVHADFARINLNFWITPDGANLDPDTGGLVVYHVPAPSTWRAREYNNDHNRQGIYEFLENNRSGRTRIPYRCNRAVLFNSNLFHETDDLHFKDGYENRRVNVTYLFGRHLSTS